MTQISDIVKSRKTKFEKKPFRPWDLSGQNQESTTEDTPPLQEAGPAEFALLTNHAIGEVLEIDVNNIIRWEYKDRPENELGDIEELANTFKTIGQQQPCIVRVAKNVPGKYELIVGERRWRAAEIAHVKLKAIVHQALDDKTASLIQAVENEKRSDLSEFAKGMSYAEKIEKGLISQKDLTDILGIRKQQVSRLLSYKRIPTILFEAIEDFRSVSARTAEEIARLAGKGEDYIEALIKLAPKIRIGKCGHNSIANEIKHLLEKIHAGSDTNQKVFNTDGRHLFTWRLDNNSIPSIHFPKDIIKLLKANVITQEELTNDVKACIAKRLSEIKD